jgi:hypothetical protein
MQQGFLSVGGMKRAGIRGCIHIPSHETAKRDETLKYPLKPACLMSTCQRKHFPIIKLFRYSLFVF